MNTVRSTGNVGDGLKGLWQNIRSGRTISRGAMWGMIIVFALLAFEVFNYSTTQFALRDMLGDLTFAGIRWATVLAIAFCGIDFAGIARIFTPQQGRDEPAEVWYLFGAWFLAAGFNAALTWWGVSVAIVNHTSAAAGSVISGHTLDTLIPIFVAVMVLLIRVLIIGTFSVAGDNLFSMADRRGPVQRPYQAQAPRPAPSINQMPSLRTASSLPRPSQYRPAPKPPVATSYEKPEPTYHSISFDASAHEESDSNRRLQ
jgi:hypothetical protein